MVYYGNGYTPTKYLFTSFSNGYLSLRCSETDWGTIKISQDNLNYMIENAPETETIYLYSVNITIDVMKKIAQTQWPKLKSIRFDYCCDLEKRAEEYLAKANWKLLEKVVFYRTRNARYFQVLDNKLINLKELSIQSFKNGRNQIKKLISKPWRQLKKLSIKFIHSDVDNPNEEMRYLCLGDWPQLEKLSLMRKGFGKKGLKYLTQSNWPKLRFLDLGGNQQKDDDIKLITYANWYKVEKSNSNYLQWIKTDFKSSLGKSQKNLSLYFLPQKDSSHNLKQEKYPEVEKFYKEKFAKIEKIQLKPDDSFMWVFKEDSD